MKTILAIAAMSLAGLGWVGSADAYKFSPAPSKFTATGPGSATLNGTTLKGTVTFKGSIAKSGRAKVKSAKFCGVGGCSLITAANLPWALKATTASTATLSNVTIDSSAGDCGPAKLTVSVSGGVISYNGPLAPCSQITFALTSKPAISIIP